MAESARRSYRTTMSTRLFIVLLLAAATSSHASDHLTPPTSDYLVLSNATGTVRVLDTKGLVLQQNTTYLPRIALVDLSPAELQTLLESKTAYASLTSFASPLGANEQGIAIEHQLQQTWHQGTSLAAKMQTRLAILKDLRDYNTEIALVSGSATAANQYALNGVPVNNQLNDRAGTVVLAAAQVEKTQLNQADGPDGQLAAQQAQENYRRSTVRVEHANNLAVIANSQTAGANQQVTDHLANCATLATRLAGYGITVSAVPPFTPVPLLTLQTEVDAERSTRTTTKP